MKKFMISLVLSSTTLLVSPAGIANTKFSVSQMSQIQLPELSFKEIMRKFYSGQMSRAFVNDQDINKMPHIALGRADKTGQTSVAVMHPLVKYHNTAREERYLVIIEKVQVNHQGFLVSCHVRSL